jgi:putative acetyltransferase
MACDQSNFVFSEGELDKADVRALLEEHFERMRAGSPPEACHVLPIEGLRDPAVRLLSIRDEKGCLLGIGALKDIGSGHGELKSMRTHDDALGRGVGKAMLDRLMAMAWDAGMKRLSCETGNSSMFAAANRLYEKAGFVRCEPFGDYQATDFTNFYTREI